MPAVSTPGQHDDSTRLVIDVARSQHAGRRAEGPHVADGLLRRGQNTLQADTQAVFTRPVGHHAKYSRVRRYSAAFE